jgi:hypothetical protein
VREILLKKQKNEVKTTPLRGQKEEKCIFFGTFLKKCAKILASYRINAYICTQKRDSWLLARVKCVRE